jgi:hypothetical protein
MRYDVGVHSILFFVRATVLIHRTPVYGATMHGKTTHPLNKAPQIYPKINSPENKSSQHSSWGQTSLSYSNLSQFNSPNTISLNSSHPHPRSSLSLPARRLLLWAVTPSTHVVVMLQPLRHQTPPASTAISVPPPGPMPCASSQSSKPLSQSTSVCPMNGASQS